MNLQAAEQPHDSPPRLVADATCTACGCACDDIELLVAGRRIVEARRACGLGRTWFLDTPLVDQPEFRVAGRTVTRDEALDQAAELLAAARYPLVWGLTETTCEAQRVAASIADWIGGTIDTPTSRLHGPAGVSFHGVGEVTGSLGEIANRGDLVVFWGADPLDSHPRHLERYSLEPKGMFLPRGRADRTCVVVDVRATPTGELADVALRIRPGADFEALWILRALAAGQTLDEATVAEATGVELAAWQDLIERMKRARFGVILFGLGITASRGRYLNAEAVLALVRDLNAYTRFVARPLREQGNGVGADGVLTWRTGFPFGVNLSRGYPRFNPGEFTADEMLSRGEVDAVLIVADDPQRLSAAACRHLARIPRVVIGSRAIACEEGAAVSMRTAPYGLCVGGTVYRMDDVPLPLRPAVASPLEGDEALLAAVDRRVRQLKHSTPPASPAS